jgi:16S rRNA (guanine966-N2)-methyltransferase
VENDRAALTALRANVAALGADATVVAGSAAAYPATAGPRFDIVVADPPYDYPDEELATVLAALHGCGRLMPHADVVLERSRRSDFSWPKAFLGQRERRYGDTVLLFGHAAG